MASLKFFIWLIPLGIISAFQFEDDKINRATKAQIEGGFNEFQKTLDGFEKLTNNEDLLKMIPKLSGFLGVTGGFISFILLFVPKSDSKELDYMKEKFAEVNRRFDRISNELDDVKNLITLETQRSEYIDAASKILFAYDQFTKHYFEDLAAVNCSTSKTCRQKLLSISETYLPAFNIKTSLYKVLRGTTETTSVFGDPLLDLIKTTYGCDINKIFLFSNSVIQLATKAQQVVLAFEKLTGTNKSISLSVNDWSTAVYNVRGKVQNVTKECYNSIDEYITNDIEKIASKTDRESSKKASIAIKNTLEKKYPWLLWTIVSYKLLDRADHGGSSTFVNLRPAKEKKNRIFQVVAHDKGTHTNLFRELVSTLQSITANTLFPSSDAAYIYAIFKQELSERNVWNKLSAFIVLKRYTDFFVANSLKYFDRYIMIKKSQRFHLRIRIWASYKTSEQISGVKCSKSCSKKGSCMLIPYTSKSTCFCNAFFQGENCQTYDKISLATSVDRMLAVTQTIPKMTDIYYEVLNVHDYIASSIGTIEDSIIRLEANLQEKYDDLIGKLSNQFQWANLITHYSTTLRSLTYYLHRFQTMNSSLPSYSKVSYNLAKIVDRPDNIPKWIFELNFLIVGRKDVPLIQHRPLIFIVMDKYRSMACTSEYTRALDNTWRQLILLQEQTFLMWAHAKSLLNESSNTITQTYKRAVLNQVDIIKRSTCELTVPHSTNLQCSGGYYVNPGLYLSNKCKAGHFLVGNSLLSCNNGSSSCNACNCNPQGSSGSECADQTGQCTCINKYTGIKCHDRNCEWSNFGSYGSCSKSCDYGGLRTKMRFHTVTRKGNGKSCSGNRQESISCFNGCCPGNFHCTFSKKCIPHSYRCNYDNDCLDSQDERSCYESCEDRYTSWESKFGSAPLERHRLNCGGANDVLKMFNLEKGKNNKLRYHFKCCKLLTNVCSQRKNVNTFTNTGHFPEQNVSCKHTGILNGFWIHRNGDQWRYEYLCCNIFGRFQSSLSCHDKETYFVKDNDPSGPSSLSGHSISCDGRYFLQSFRLIKEWTDRVWSLTPGYTGWGRRKRQIIPISRTKYEYKCCKIN